MQPGDHVHNGYAAYEIVTLSGDMAHVRRGKVRTDPVHACMGEWDMNLSELSPGDPPSRKRTQ
jgi:hypothetical protein